MFKLQVVIIPQSVYSASNVYNTENMDGIGNHENNTNNSNNRDNDTNGNGNNSNSIFRSHLSPSGPGFEISNQLNAISTPIPNPLYLNRYQQHFNSNNSFTYSNRLIHPNPYQLATKSNIKKFLHITSSNNTLDLVAKEINKRFLKLYPNEEPLQILKIQNIEECDLDPDYNVSMVFDTSNICRVIVSNEFIENNEGINSNGKRYLANDLNSVMKKVRKSNNKKGNNNNNNNHNINNTENNLSMTSSIWSFDDYPQIASTNNHNLQRQVLNKPLGMRDDPDTSSLVPNVSLAIPDVDDTVIHPTKSEHLRIASPIIATGSPTRITSGMLNIQSQPDLSNIAYGKDTNGSFYADDSVDGKRSSVPSKEDAMKNKNNDRIILKSPILEADLSTSSINGTLPPLSPVLDKSKGKMETESPLSKKPETILKSNNHPLPATEVTTQSRNKRQKVTGNDKNVTPVKNNKKLKLNSISSSPIAKGKTINEQQKSSEKESIESTDSKGINKSSKESNKEIEKNATNKTLHPTTNNSTNGSTTTNPLENIPQKSSLKDVVEKAVKEIVKESKKSAKKVDQVEKQMTTEDNPAKRTRNGKNDSDELMIIDHINTSNSGSSTVKKINNEVAANAKKDDIQTQPDDDTNISIIKNLTRDDTPEDEKLNHPAKPVKVTKLSIGSISNYGSPKLNDLAGQQKLESTQAPVTSNEKLAVEPSTVDLSASESVTPNTVSKTPVKIPAKRGRPKKIRETPIKEFATSEIENIIKSTKSTNKKPAGRPKKSVAAPEKKSDETPIKESIELANGTVETPTKKAAEKTPAKKTVETPAKKAVETPIMKPIEFTTNQIEPSTEKEDNPSTKNAIELSTSNETSKKGDKHATVSIKTSQSKASLAPSNIQLDGNKQSGPSNVAVRRAEISGDIDTSNILPQKNRIINPIVIENTKSPTNSITDSSSDSSSDSDPSDLESDSDESSDEKSRPTLVKTPKAVAKAAKPPADITQSNIQIKSPNADKPKNTFSSPSPDSKLNSSQSTQKSKKQTDSILNPKIHTPTKSASNAKPENKSSASTLNILKGESVTKRASLPRLSAFLDKKLPEVRMQKNKSQPAQSNNAKANSGSDSDDSSSGSDSSSDSGSDSDSDSESNSSNSDSDSDSDSNSDSEDNSVKDKFINAKTAKKFVTGKKSKNKPKKNKGFFALMKDSKK